MVCIHCGQKTHIINSRLQKRSNQVWRRRECLNCQAVFTTEEKTDYSAAWLVRDQSGALQPFSHLKLFLSLYKSCEHRKTALSDAEALTDTVIKKLLGRSATSPAIDRQLIIQTTLVALNRFDRAASSHYQAFHKFQTG